MKPFGQNLTFQVLGTNRWYTMAWLEKHVNFSATHMLALGTPGENAIIDDVDYGASNLPGDAGLGGE